MSYLGKDVAALTKASARREPDESGLVPTFPVTAASSEGRCNTIQCVDSAMLPQEKRSFWLYSVKT